MIDLSTEADVICSDGDAGISTNVIVNPINRQITHVVVQSDLPPFYEYLVPVGQVEKTSPHLIKLKCTLETFSHMKLFKVEEYIPAGTPGTLFWPYQVPGIVMDEVTYIPVEHKYIPLDEIAIRRGALVKATDGYIGQVDELLINSSNMQVTHLVLLERNILTKREITIPVSQVDRVDEDTVYLKLDRLAVEKLPTTPIQRWRE
jgi:hypothetical protein